MRDEPLHTLVPVVATRLRTAGLDVQASLLTRAVPSAPATAADLPVVRHLDRALELGRGRVTDDVVGPLAILAPAVAWTQTAAYVDRPPNEGFLARYAHATLAGPPDGTSPSMHGIALGVLLLGPGADYPSHEHPADEVYLPLTGARWAHAVDEEPRPEPAGALIHHRPWQPHGMRTDAEPLLALYVWTGDVTTASRFCAG